MNIIQQYEAEQIASLSAARAVPEFAPGDTVRVAVKVVEGERTRTQAFEGVCIARSNKGLNSNFTVRKISYGEGVERVFPLYAPTIAEITVVRRGDVRRAKLYYLRGRRGKSARIAEKARAVVVTGTAGGTDGGHAGRRHDEIASIADWRDLRSTASPSCYLMRHWDTRRPRRGYARLSDGHRASSACARPVLPPGGITHRRSWECRPPGSAICAFVSDHRTSSRLGTFTVLIGGQAAAQMGSMTAHGGVVMGLGMTVLI